LISIILFDIKFLEMGSNELKLVSEQFIIDIENRYEFF
jgi:hypothetical protein